MTERPKVVEFKREAWPPSSILTEPVLQRIVEEWMQKVIE